MYGMTKIKGFINHKGLKLMATLFAASIFFPALTAQAQAGADYKSPTVNTTEQTTVHYSNNYCNAFWNSTQVSSSSQAQGTNTYGGLTTIHDGMIGLAPGQTVSITAPSSYLAADGSIGFFKYSALKVYDRESHGVTERESGLVYSGESGGLNEASPEYGHTFTLSYSDLPVQGEPRTGRKEVWIEIESIAFPPTQTRAEEFSAIVLRPKFELIDPNGRTVMFGLLLPALAMSGPTQVQLGSFYVFENFQGGVSVGAAAGQTVRIQIEAADAANSSLNQPSGEPDVITGSSTSAAHVKVFNATTGDLLWSRELTGLTPGHHTLDINRDELREAGDPGTGRIQLWIELVLDGMKVSLPAFEVFDNQSGKTEAAGPMRESMETMKKAWKDASSTPEGKQP